MPTNIQAEQALLGALLANNKAMDRCDGLEPEHFADPIHGRIYQAIVRRIASGQLADAVMLKAEFENSGILDDVGGTVYLAQLLTAMVGIINAGEYARAIRDAWLRRELIDAGEEAVNAGFGADPDMDGEAAVAATMDRLLAMGEHTRAADTGDFGAALDTALDAADAAHRGVALPGLLTGIPGLDAKWCGLFAGALDILAARSEHGKTALGMQIAENIARKLLADALARVAAGHALDQEHVQVFSLEMSRADLAVRMLASQTGIQADDIRSGQIGGGRASALLRARADLRTLPLIVQDRRGMTLSDIRLSARIAKRRKRVRLVVIDHLHRIKPDKAMLRLSRTEQVQATTEGLKDMAGDLDIPVLLLAQLSREAERRDGPDAARPRVSDIQYAGERDGDNVILLWRPILHMGAAPPTLPDRIKAEQRTEADAAWWRRHDAMRDKAEAIFAKRRGGPTGSTWLHFDGPRTRFSDPPDATTSDLWSEEQAARWDG
jgi:replicative DNA helicase